MEIRVAVGSSDGKFIDQHFGRAVQFILFDLDIDSGVQKTAGIRKLPDFYEAGSHSENRLLALVQLLGDCRAILVSEIGPRAQSIVHAQGIEVFCTNGNIQDAVKKLAKSKYFITLARGHQKG